MISQLKDTVLRDSENRNQQCISQNEIKAQNTHELVSCIKQVDFNSSQILEQAQQDDSQIKKMLMIEKQQENVSLKCQHLNIDTQLASLTKGESQINEVLERVENKDTISEQITKEHIEQEINEQKQFVKSQLVDNNQEQFQDQTNNKSICLIQNQLDSIAEQTPSRQQLVKRIDNKIYNQEIIMEIGEQVTINKNQKEEKKKLQIQFAENNSEISKQRNVGEIEKIKNEQANKQKQFFLLENKNLEQQIQNQIENSSNNEPIQLDQLVEQVSDQNKQVFPNKYELKNCYEAEIKQQQNQVDIRIKNDSNQELNIKTNEEEIQSNHLFIEFYKGEEFFCNIDFSVDYSEFDESVQQNSSFVQLENGNQNIEKKQEGENTQYQQQLAQVQNSNNMGSNSLKFSQDDVQLNVQDQQNQVELVSQQFTEVKQCQVNSNIEEQQLDQDSKSNISQIYQIGQKTIELQSNNIQHCFETFGSQTQQVSKETTEIQKYQEVDYSNDHGISQECFYECKDELQKKGIIICKFLNKGGFGAVYKGLDSLNQREVAIKLSFMSQDGNSEQTEQIFENMKYEKNIIDQIKCYKYVVKTFDLFITQKSHIIIQIMEYCETDLQSYIESRKKCQNPLNKEEIIDIYFQLINVLVEIHTNNIVHLDIKPLNILRTNEGIYKLTDFGISQLLKQDNSSCAELFKGLSKKYSSPEQYQLWYQQESYDYQNSNQNLHSEIEFQQVSQSSDVFSMGLTFLYILQLELSDKTADQIRNGKYEFDSYHTKISFLTFIRYYMLCYNPINRCTALQLKPKLMYYFPNEDQLFQKDFQRIQNLIEELRKQRQNYKYLSYLYLLLNNLNPTKKSISQFYFYYKQQIKEEYIQKSQQIQKNSRKVVSLNDKFQINFVVAESLSQLGLSYERLGNDQKALEYKLKALSMRESLYQGNHPDVAESLSQLGISYTGLGNDQKALEYYLKALSMREALYQGNHPDVALSLSQLGFSYGKLGNDQKALELFKKTLSIREALYQGNHPDVAKSFSQLGISYGKLGNDSKALEFNLKALSMEKALYQGNHPDVAQSLSQLGISYTLFGDDQIALEYFNEALRMREALYQRNHPDIAQSLSQLGVSYVKLGNDQKSLEFNLKALNIREALFQGNHPDVAQSLSQLAISYERLGNDQKALEFNLKALNMRVALYQGNHPDIAESLSQLGVSYERLGNYQKALESDLKALSMRVALYQGNHPDVAQSLSQLGISYTQFDDDQIALEYFNEALRMREALYQGNHSDVAQSYSLLGVSYGKLGNDKKALEYLNNALSMREALYQGNHPDIAESFSQLGVFYTRLGNNQKALEYQLRALSMREKLCQVNHPDVAESLSQLGASYGKLGNDQKALEFDLKALSMREALYQGNHPDVVESLSQLGVSYTRVGNHQKALEFFNKALSMREALNLGNHPDVAESLSQLGVSYGKLGQDQKALKFLNKALIMREALYQENHPDVALSLQQLGVSYGKLGNYKKALEFFNKALSMREALYQGNHPALAQSFSQLGVTYTRLGNNQKGQEFFNKALGMIEALCQGNHQDIAQSLLQLGVSHARLSNICNALQQLIKDSCSCF